MDKVYVGEVMTKHITACSPDTKIKDVVNILSKNHISCLVVTENSEPVGIITERDLVAIMEDMLNDVTCGYLPISNFMTSPAHTVHSYITLQEAVEFSRNNTIRHLPVVDERNKLVGLLTQTNMVNGLYHINSVLTGES